MASEPQIGDRVVSVNGTTGTLERITRPHGGPVAWVRSDDGFVQTFGLSKLRHEPAEEA